MKSFVIIAASLLASTVSFASEKNYAFPKDCETLAWDLAEKTTWGGLETFASLEVDGDYAATVRADDVELIIMKFELHEGRCRLVSLEKAFR